MTQINKTALRQLHYKIAPIMIFPLLLTVITGTLFQVAVVTGNADNFIWLLELHRGKFGRINLEMIYPFFKWVWFINVRSYRCYNVVKHPKK
ncbi:hypothetical protein [Crocosphaera watsonii]|uniref:PepSY domain-containing protein n=1 Tax=Crocosphaera watsonii WH 8502 TaxID=423474 RepID=T2I968_CROWT|nr:hypothetical protein [Crocosphaera watsonii]CCQ50076.1 hypothetical protein CWATWH8502_1318 [Crocosphaera watsonii WH 8502]